MKNRDAEGEGGSDNHRKGCSRQGPMSCEQDSGSRNCSLTAGSCARPAEPMFLFGGSGSSGCWPQFEVSELSVVFTARVTPRQSEAGVEDGS